MKSTSQRLEAFKVDLRRTQNAEIFSRRRALNAGVSGAPAPTGSLPSLESLSPNAPIREIRRGLAKIEGWFAGGGAAGPVESTGLADALCVLASFSEEPEVIAEAVAGLTNCLAAPGASCEFWEQRRPEAIFAGLAGRGSSELTELCVHGLANAVAGRPRARSALLEAGFFSSFLGPAHQAAKNRPDFPAKLVWLAGNLVEGCEKGPAMPATEARAFCTFAAELCEPGGVEVPARDLLTFIEFFSRSASNSEALLRAPVVIERLHKFLILRETRALALEALANLIEIIEPLNVSCFQNEFFFDNYAFILRNSKKENELISTFFNLSNLVLEDPLADFALQNPLLFEPISAILREKSDRVRKEVFFFLGNLLHKLRSSNLQKLEANGVFLFLAQGMLINNKDIKAIAIDALAAGIERAVVDPPALGPLREILVRVEWLRVAQNAEDTVDVKHLDNLRFVEEFLLARNSELCLEY